MTPIESTNRKLNSELRKLKVLIADYFDGQSKWHEIQANTGLSEERCKEMAVIINDVLNEVLEEE